MNIPGFQIPALVLTIIVPLAIVDLIAKGFASWKAARNNQLGWFIAVLLINSLGILPAIYLTFFQKKR